MPTIKELEAKVGDILYMAIPVLRVHPNIEKMRNAITDQLLIILIALGWRY